MKKFFIDKDCEPNLEHGLPFFAAGIIEQDFRSNNEFLIQSFVQSDISLAPTKSGKDFAVVFIDPWGIVNRAWRAFDDIRIIDVDSCDFEILKDAIEILERRLEV